MHIHQLSLSHIRDQDRILVRVKSTEADEFRLWLTRRMAIQLFPVMDKVLADQIAKGGSLDTSHLIGADEQTRSMMAEFQGADALKQADFDTPYDNDVRNLPLGAEPLLVTEISFKPLRPELLEAVFSEAVKAAGEPRKLRMVIDLKLMHSFIHMLRNCFSKARWGELSSAGGPAPAGVAQDPSDTKPRYLN
jgi:hypothetical protein